MTPAPLFVLQAAAAARVAGKPSIIKAAKSGDIELVRDHVTADPACVHAQGFTSFLDGYDARPRMRI